MMPFFFHFATTSTHFPFPADDEECVNVGVSFAADSDPRPVVGLVSYPGSGNTWTRYLLEGATGIFTGSLYNDIHLKKEGE